MLYLNILLTVKKTEDVERVRELLSEQGRLSRQEPGCARFEVYHSQNDPKVFMSNRNLPCSDDCACKQTFPRSCADKPWEGVSCEAGFYLRRVRSTSGASKFTSSAARTVAPVSTTRTAISSRVGPRSRTWLTIARAGFSADRVRGFASAKRPRR